MKIHELKTHPEAYLAVAHGIKRHEFRLDDRGFEVGDILKLRSFDPVGKAYLPDPTLAVFVSYITRGPAFGVPENYVVMSIGETIGSRWGT